MSLAQLRVELQSTLGGLAGLRFSITGKHIVVRDLTQEGIGAAQPCICQCIVWIFLDSFLIGVNALVEIAAVRPIKAAAEIFVVSLRVNAARARFCAIRAQCSYGKCYANLAGDRRGNLVLNMQNIAEVAGVRIGPQMCLVADLNELNVNADLVSPATHAPFKGILDV